MAPRGLTPLESRTQAVNLGAAAEEAAARSLDADGALGRARESAETSASEAEALRVQRDAASAQLHAADERLEVARGSKRRANASRRCLQTECGPITLPMGGDCGRPVERGTMRSPQEA